MRNTARAGAFVAALVLAATAACTSTPSSTPPTSTPTTAVATRETTADVTTTPPASTSSSGPVSSSSTPTSTTDAPSSTDAPVEWPATLTPEQVDQAKAALTAYRGYSALVDQALADPSADWSTEIKNWAAGPAEDTFLRGVQATAELGQYTSGSLVLSPQVTDVQTALVKITDCVDATNSGFFNKDGVSIKAPDAPGSYFRHPAQIEVGEFEGGRWLVQSVSDDYTVTC